MPLLADPTGLSDADAPAPPPSLGAGLQPASAFPGATGGLGLQPASDFPAAGPGLTPAQAAEPVDMPDHAQFIPESVMQGIQQQETADAWAQPHMEALAEQWAQIQQSHAAQMVQDALTQARQAMMGPGMAIQGGMGAAQNAGQNAIGAGVGAVTNPLEAGVNTVNNINAFNGAGQPPVPTPAQAAQQGIISPQEAAAAQIVGGLAAGGPQGVAGPVALATDVAGAGVRALGSVADNARFLESIGNGGALMPEMAGGSNDLVQISDLTADHPIVQAVAKAQSVDPAAVAKVLQSKGFNPVNMAKGISRLSPVQTAAFTTYKVANDAELANGLIRAAAEATGKAEPTAEDIWDSVQGIGMHAAETPGEPPTLDSVLGNGEQPPAGTNPPKGPPSATPPSFGDAWRAVNRGIVQAKLMNPLIHTWNLLSETMSQYADPRALAGIVGDFKTAESAMRDPTVAQQLVQESGGRLNLPTMRAYADDLGNTTGNAINKLPAVGGIKTAYDDITALNHKLLFESLGQRLQLASYEGAKRMGMDPETAAAYANAKFGQISDADRNDLMRWIGDNAAFAGRWVQGTGIQLGSLVGRPTFGGYASDLSKAQQARLASGLRGDFMKGNALLVGSHALINHTLSGHWPWQNETGRWLDIDTGQKTTDGKEIYVPDPFFRREQDALHLLAVPVPGNPVVQATGTTTTAALANKTAPLIGTGLSLAGGSQWVGPADQPPGVQGGPPIISAGAQGGDMGKEMGAFAFNQLSPVQVQYGSPTKSAEGIKLHSPEPSFSVGPGSSKAGVAAGVLGAVMGTNPAAGPRDIGTKAEYFNQSDTQAYGADTVKLFQDAGIQLSTLPSTLSKGTGSAKKSVPTTDADRQVFQQAYGTALQKGLQQQQRKLDSLPASQRKGILTTIESQAFQKGKDAVLKGMPADEIVRRTDVASGSPSGQATISSNAWARAVGSTPRGSSAPAGAAAPAASNASGGLTAASWAKALSR